MTTFQKWLHQRSAYESNDPPHIVADELLRAIWSAGPSGISKRGLLAYLRSDGGEEIDRLIQLWLELGQVEMWRAADGATMLRWSGRP